jgi:hypothetical protein
LPPTGLKSCDARSLGDAEQDRLPQALVRVHDRDVAVVTREPADHDQVARHVQAALGAVPDVVQRRILDVLPTDPTARRVAIDHELAHMAGHQAQPLELQLSNTHSSTLRKEVNTMITVAELKEALDNCSNCKHEQAERPGS